MTFPNTLAGINAHVHLPPNFSAFDTAAQAVSLAASQNIRVLGASNYYDYQIYTEFATLAEAQGIFPLFGLEVICLIDALQRVAVKINDPGNPGKMYLCGKGMTAFNPPRAEAVTLLQTVRNNDARRMAAVVEKLEDVFGGVGFPTDLTADAIKECIAVCHGAPLKTVYLQERHVAQAFQDALFAYVPEVDRPSALHQLFGAASAAPTDAVVVQNEIRSHLLKSGKPAYIPETFVDFAHAYSLIAALGAIPSYPVLADGIAPITEYEQSPAALIADLKTRGIPAAEFIPSRNTPTVLSEYVHTLRDADLFITAGTEHNTREILPLAPACLGGAPIPDDIQEIFWEGACIVAAHQDLTARGLPGFAPGSSLGEFRALGESVLARYQAIAQP